MAVDLSTGLIAIASGLAIGASAIAAAPSFVMGGYCIPPIEWTHAVTSNTNSDWIIGIIQ